MCRIFFLAHLNGSMETFQLTPRGWLGIPDRDIRSCLVRRERLELPHHESEATIIALRTNHRDVTMARIATR